MGALILKEKDVLHAVRDYLRVQGFYTIRHQASMGSHEGLCDLQAVKDGYTFYIETKATNGRLSPGQMKFIDAMADHGITVYVVRDVSELDAILYNLFQEGKIKTYQRGLF